MERKANGKILGVRAGADVSLFLRSHGGVQTSKKGKKGYNRKVENSNARKEVRGF